jgi:flagellar biosynthesis protein FlhF
MQIKTYTSDSVAKAVEQIRQELGEGAVILNTKKKSRRRLLGLIPSLEYEITAAAEPVNERTLPETAEPEPEATSEQQIETYETAGSDEDEKLNDRREQSRELEKQLSRLSAEIGELKNLVRLQTPSPKLRNTLLREGGELLAKLFWTEDPRDRIDPDRAHIICDHFEGLVEQGLDDNLALLLNQGAARRLPPGEDAGDRLKIRLNKGISELIQTSPLETREGRICAFVGPTGVGKTTTIAKLAALLSLKEGRKVRLLTMDTYRIAAAEQLKTYGEIIGVPVIVLFSVMELDEELARAEPGEFLLIDTTGHSYRKTGEFAALAAYLKDNPNIETHLVLSANTNPEDLRLSIDGFEVFGPDKLVFTKLDEASSFGMIVNELVRTVKPLSYLTNGQNVPEDLIVPSSGTVADLVVPLN